MYRRGWVVVTWTGFRDQCTHLFKGLSSNVDHLRVSITDMGNHRAFIPLCLRELRRRSTSSVMKCHLEQTEVSCRVQRTGKPEGFGNASNNTSEECGISGEAAKGHNSTRSAVELSDEADIPSTLKMQVFQVTTRLSTCYWGPTLNQSTTTPPLRLREYSQRTRTGFQRNQHRGCSFPHTVEGPSQMTRLQTLGINRPIVDTSYQPPFNRGYDFRSLGDNKKRSITRTERMGSTPPGQLFLCRGP